MITPRLLFALPQNFAFLSRLPARFQALVLKSHAPVNGVRIYELKINNSTLRLRSEVELPEGRTITIGKTDDLSRLKLITEKEGSSLPPLKEDNGSVKSIRPPETNALNDFISPWGSVFTALGLKIIQEEGLSPKFTENQGKYAFELGGDIPVKGVFIARNAGTLRRFSLYLHIPGANAEDQAALESILKEFSVDSVRFVDAQTLEVISRGVQVII